MKIYGLMYSIETKKKKEKLQYIIHDKRKMRGNFFFIKIKIFDLQRIQINFLRLEQRTKISATDCYIISHRFFRRFFNSPRFQRTRYIIYNMYKNI